VKNPFGLFRIGATCALAGVTLLGADMQQAQAQVTPQWKSKPLADFRLVPNSCIPKAYARVKIEKFQENQHMRVEVAGLPANIGFDVFVIQVPTAPFGLSWYQGDISTNSKGYGAADFVGIFSNETFSVAPGKPVPAPTPHTSLPFPDASLNPVTAPLHQFHLGLWFDSPEAAKKAGCPTAVTPFNGDHTAGIQAFNTSQFPALNGPLGQIKP
jgi:hypothetical protein